MISNKSFCATNETIITIKRNSTDKEKPFYHHSSNKRQIAKINKALIKLNSKDNN